MIAEKKLRGKKLDEGGKRTHTREAYQGRSDARVTSRLHPSRYFGCQTAKKESGPVGFPQEAGPLLTSLR
jgi:hypothetical protein